MEDREIPLFRFNTALLPGELLPIRVADPRDRRLVSYCTEGQRPGKARSFAISASLPGYGCSAAILSTLRKYNDGGSLVLALGERPFRLLEVIPEAEFPRARVEFVEEVSERTNFALYQQALNMYRDLRGLDRSYPSAPESLSRRLSFQLGSALRLTQAERLQLLQLGSENERLKTILCLILQRSVPISGTVDPSRVAVH